MSLANATQILDRDRVIDGLIHLRQEWQEAACGIPLVEVKGSVGLILADVMNVIDLLPEEVSRILGNETVSDFAQLHFPM